MKVEKSLPWLKYNWIQIQPKEPQYKCGYCQWVVNQSNSVAFVSEKIVRKVRLQLYQ